MKTHQNQEEGRRTTTKSERTSASSLTNATPEHKKIIDAEEEQRRKSLDDRDRLEVDCRIFTTKGIPDLLDKTGMRHELAMIAETTAGAIRSILLRAADRGEYNLSQFAGERMDIRLNFHEPFSVKAVIREEGADGEN